MDESELAELRAEIKAEVEREQIRLLNHVLDNYESEEFQSASKAFLHGGPLRDYDRAKALVRSRIDRFRLAYVNTERQERRYELRCRRQSQEEDDGA